MIDDLGRIIRTRFADGSQDQVFYDGYLVGERVIKKRFVNAQNQTKTEYKNSIDQLVKVVDNIGTTIDYRYNSVSDLLQVHLNGILQTQIEYDSLGRKTKMQDWDKGAQNGKFWQYQYNALGELTYQRDPKGQEIRIYRDRSGRKIRQLDRNASNNYVADYRWVYNNSPALSNSIGQLIKQYDALDSELVKEYFYDSNGRNDVTITNIAGKDFVTSTVFDSIGRVYETYDPSGNDQGLRYLFNSHGYLEKVVETKNNDGTVYRKITAMDNFGNATYEILGNGLVTSKYYDDRTGRLTRIKTSRGATPIQNLEYVWDNIGRLASRHSIAKNQLEVFTYDDLNRIKTVNGVNQVDYDYRGNISWKKNKGSYTYGSSCQGVTAGAHAVTQAGSASYCYDLNGNMTSGDGRSIEYAIFDKATRISRGGHTTEFAYSASRSRYKRIDTSSAGVTTTFYLGSVEFIQKPTGETFYRRTVPGAVIEVPSTGVNKVSYLHKDHLGSTDVITDSNGITLSEYSFDIFGKKRIASNWTLPDTTIQFSPLKLTSRAYTGHESADEVGVIHMNGRIYDPELGRFMQADPQIDGVTDSQGYNRYTYVRNNPLAYTDPTGFRRSGGLKNWQRFFRFITFNNNKDVATLRTIAGAIWCGPAAPACAAAIAGAVSTAGTVAGGGNLTQGLRTGARTFATSYVSAIIAGQIGEKFGTLNSSAKQFGSALSHGTLSGVMSVLNGGKFGHGFASAFASKLIMTKLDMMGELSGKDPKWNRAARVMIAGLIGGTVSQATGGKFANGAIQSAIQWNFNAESQKEIKAKRKGIVKRAKKALANKEKYALGDKKGLFGPGSYKCNKFVTDVSNAAGANINLNTDKYGNSWPPLAGTFGNSSVDIDGWSIVLIPQAGDIVAQQRGYGDASGHVGIIVDSQLNVISARDYGLSLDPINSVFPVNYRGNSFQKGPIIYRRYTGQ
ncbi:MAG: RHS repeat-associated core domain-containing protein [Enterobacterales bacterium]|nr:RHS repeat-associated core domain-containing protein [Enterobacterales bacterium]